MSQMITIPDALDAIERNIKAFLVIAGETPGYVIAQVDCYTGTASIKHTRCIYNNTIDCVVMLPAMKSQTLIGKDELDRWIGYFIHELCHALYTDEAAWKQACTEHLNDIVNGMEDVRIERKFNQSGIAANSQDLLNKLLAFVVSQLPANYDPNDVTNLAWLFAMVGRIELCGYDLPEAMPHMAKINPAYRALCDWVMAKLDVAQNTMDVLIIARELQKKLASKPGSNAKVNPGKGNGQPGESDKPSGETSHGEPDSDGQDSSGDVENGNEAQPGDDTEGENGSPEETESDTGGNVPTGGMGGGKPGEIEGDITQVNPVVICPVTQQKLDDAKELIRTYEAHDESTIIDAIRQANKSAGASLKPLDEARSANNIVAELMRAAKLRAQVARVLKAEENEFWDRGRASGRLDRFALARVGAGHVENVYAKRRIGGGYETEIDVLVDASGSMGGNDVMTNAGLVPSPMKAATILAYVIAQAAQQVGVKCQVSRFTSAHGFPRVAKAPNESASSKSVQKRFGEMMKGTGGSTPLTRSIIQVSTKLAARAPMKRKMLFVVCDGDCDNGQKAVRKACDYAERLGVETVALCIDLPPQDGFRLAVRCSSQNIAEAGLGLLVKALSREA